MRPGNDEVLGSLCPVENPPWAVVTARDVGVAFAAVRSMAERTALLALVTGLVAMAAGVGLARRLTTPLRHLAEVSTAVAQGDFSRQVPVTSRNELGQLAENFNVMAVEIDRYRELVAGSARRRTRSCWSTRSARSRRRSTPRTRTRAATRSA